MANPLTNQSGGGIPPRPEAPAAVVEQRPSSPTSPAGEPRRPALTAANLDLLEDHHTADTIELDQVSSVATMFMLLGPDKFSVKEGTLKTIADRAQERLTADGTDLAGLTVHQALEEFHAYLESGGETKILSQLQKFPEKQRLPLEQELLSVLLRGHVSAEVLSLILGGGFRAQDQAEPTNPHPELAAPFAAFHPSHDKTPGYVDLYLATLPEQSDMRFLTLHEIAHALILAPVRGGLIYRTEDLANLLSLALAVDPSATANQGASDRPGALDPKELLILQRAMGDGNRAVIKPFETAYTASLLDTLDKNPTPALRSVVLAEMLAERLATFLASDGTLADFLHKRLLYAHAVQVATGTIDPTHPSAKLAQELELMKIQAHQEHWSYETLVPKLQDFSRRLPGLADFLAETIFLDRRFSRALRGPDNLPISLLANKYRLQLIAKLKGSQATVPIPTLAEILTQHHASAVTFERLPLGQPLPDRKGKKFWQVLAEAFSAFMRALGFNF